MLNAYILHGENVHSQARRNAILASEKLQKELKSTWKEVPWKCTWQSLQWTVAARCLKKKKKAFCIEQQNGGCGRVRQACRDSCSGEMCSLLSSLGNKCRSVAHWGRQGVGRRTVVWSCGTTTRFLFSAKQRRQPLAVEKGRMLRGASHGLHRCITLLPKEEPSLQWQPSLWPARAVWEGWLVIEYDSWLHKVATVLWRGYTASEKAPTLR